MEPIVDLELLRTFVTVARTGEFKKAAEIICRSQAAISMQIKRLETQTGTCLMTRNNRGIRLTDAGETLLSYGEQLLKLSSATLTALKTDNLHGKLNIGIPTDYAQDFLNHFMPVLQREQPNLESRIVCDRSRSLRKRVAAGELDIAIVSAETEDPDDHLIWTERLLWSAPVSSRLEELSPMPIAMYEDSCIVRDLCLAELQRSKVNYRIAFGSPVMDNLAAAVEQGYAIALLPESVLRNHHSRTLPNRILNSYQLLRMCLISADNMDDSTVEHLAHCCRLAANAVLKFDP